MEKEKKKPRCPNCKKMLYTYTITIKRKLQAVRKDEARFCPKCKKEVLLKNAVRKTDHRKMTITSTYEEY